MLPVTTICMDNVEADDVMAFLQDHISVVLVKNVL